MGGTLSSRHCNPALERRDAAPIVNDLSANREIHGRLTSQLGPPLGTLSHTLAHSDLSGKTQANRYEAFFRAVWDREWFVGARVWKWYADHAKAGGRKSIDFTLQNKPAETVIARGFLRLGNGAAP